ncbi:MAG: carbonic anhydrase, partial [Polyangiaceae bacterium]|nr:carbonic anhydrase [Polyangiaceae bacterium]
MSTSPRLPVPHAEALARLRAGNDRFVQNVRSIESFATQARRDELLAGQTPFAIILACADSRAPAEIVFDCGLGDLFVVRVAGNVVAPSIVGSVEFAAAKFGTELVVVMGHTLCGAIGATLDSLAGTQSAPSENIRDIVERIAPSLAELPHAAPRDERFVRAATRANVRASANHLRHGSRVLEQRIAEGRLVVLGAEYELETGKVCFFDGVPAQDEALAEA